jgi:hypothetical protein
MTVVRNPETGRYRCAAPDCQEPMIVAAASPAVWAEMGRRLQRRRTITVKAPAGQRSFRF